MRKLVASIAVMCAVVGMSAGVNAAEKKAGGKNMCLLYNEGCNYGGMQEPTLTQTVKALKAEIKKGSAVYDRAELALLKAKLQNAQFLLGTIEGTN